MTLHATKRIEWKDKQTIDVGFAPSPLVQYDGTDKVLPAIYKRTKGNAVDQEELVDSNIRILMAKKMSCSTWNIRNGKTPSSPNLGASLTTYGYAAILGRLRFSSPEDWDDIESDS